MIEDFEKVAEMIAKAAGDKKAHDVAMLDMTNLSPVTDYFVLASAGSVPQAQAIADNIEDKLAEAGVPLLRKEGFRDSRWILLDYGSAVAHVFVQEDREFYNLERLWGDAKVRRFED